MFESARLKIERANHHIDDLQRQFEAFVETNPHNISIGTHPETGETTVRIRFNKEMPTEFALIISDAIHNLRCALDHMTWELIGNDGGTQDRYLKFPTGDNRTNFEASCEGIKTPSAEIRNLFKEREAFPGGRGDLLYVIHLLDNADKHTVIAPVIRASRISKLQILYPDGRVLMTMTDCGIGGGTGPYAIITNVPNGCSVELDNDVKVTPEIFFGHGIVAGQEIIPLLHQFSHETARAIGVIEKAVS